MEPGAVSGMTRVLGQPEGWDAEKHGECQALPVKDQTVKGHPVISSAWIFSDEERAVVAAGGILCLHVWGVIMPPVAFSVEMPGPVIIDD